MNIVRNTWRRGRGGKLIVGLGALATSCIVCSCISLAVPSARTTATATPTPAAQLVAAVNPAPSPTTAAIEAATTAEPTSTVASTDTPQPPPATSAPPTATLEPTATESPTAVPAGSSKENPAPVGTEFVAHEFKIVVSGSVRPADKTVRDGNMFNSKPERGEEYVQVDISVTCMKDSKEQCRISPYEFKMYGSEGVVYKPQTLLAGVDGMLDSGGTEFFGGATLQNKSVFFIVGQKETDLVLEFEAGLIFRANAFFAIPDKT